MPQGTPTKVKKRKKSVLKRAAQSIAHHQINRSHRTFVRSMIKDLRHAIDAKDAAAAGSLLRPTLSAIDRAISKGILHENTANRYKSRLTVACNSLRAAKPA
jgi:small subunit ribosomal protein S20